MPESNAVVEVAAAVIIQDGRCLITQRLATTHLGGLWEFPGGKRRPGESLPDCLCRELKEELDLTVEVGGAVKVVEHAYPDRTVRIHFYRCRILCGRPRTLGNQAYRWVPLPDLSRFPFPEADQPLIRDLQRQPGAGNWRI